MIRGNRELLGFLSLFCVILVLAGCGNTATDARADRFPWVGTDRCYWLTVPASVEFRRGTAKMMADSLPGIRKFSLRWYQKPGEIIVRLHDTSAGPRDQAGHELVTRRSNRIRATLKHYGISDDNLRFEVDNEIDPADTEEREVVELYNPLRSRDCIQRMKDEFSLWESRNCLASPRRGSDEQCQKIRELIEHTHY